MTFTFTWNEGKVLFGDVSAYSLFLDFLFLSISLSPTLLFLPQKFRIRTRKQCPEGLYLFFTLNPGHLVPNFNYATFSLSNLDIIIQSRSLLWNMYTLIIWPQQGSVNTSVSMLVMEHHGHAHFVITNILLPVIALIHITTLGNRRRECLIWYSRSCSMQTDKWSLWIISFTEMWCF